MTATVGRVRHEKVFGFSDGVMRRDRERWPYAHLLVATDDTLLLETLHGSAHSLRMEVEASAARIADGKANRARQVPGRIYVDGIAEHTWQGWVRAADERGGRPDTPAELQRVADQMDAGNR